MNGSISASSSGAGLAAGSPRPSPSAPGFFLTTACCLCGKEYKWTPTAKKPDGVSHGYCKECQENSPHPSMVRLRQMRSAKAPPEALAEALTGPLLIEIAAKEQPFGMVQALDEAARLHALGRFVWVIE